MTWSFWGWRGRSDVRNDCVLPKNANSLLSIHVRQLTATFDSSSIDYHNIFLADVNLHEYGTHTHKWKHRRTYKTKQMESIQFYESNPPLHSSTMSNTKTNLILLNIYLFIMYIVFSCMHAYTPEEGTIFHYRCLWNTMWSLGNDLRTS